MKYLTEFHDPELARRLLDSIAATATRRWTLMEVCGGQTHAIIRHGLDQLLADQVEFIHGPGCPVCVTPLEMIDRALAIAARPEVIFCSFGDMLRVPGSETDLFSVRARGGDVRVVYSPLDAVKLAEAHRDRQVVFFAVGFETTAPGAGGAPPRRPGGAPPPPPPPPPGPPPLGSTPRGSQVVTPNHPGLHSMNRY
ncbi:hydrogenase formation protein HypD, partial [Frankia sp. AgB32]|uniref:hydrogenase formation protein HypD n=1 Tax=Frankia sp. AgB32 TaxID=631119 RepID=UPI00200D91A1